MCPELQICTVIIMPPNTRSLLILTCPRREATYEILNPFDVIEHGAYDNVCLNHTGVSVLTVNSHHTQRASHCGHTSQGPYLLMTIPQKAVEHKSKCCWSLHIPRGDVLRPRLPALMLMADADAAYPGGWCALSRARIAWMEQTRISCPIGGYAACSSY